MSRLPTIPRIGMSRVRQNDRQEQAPFTEESERSLVRKLTDGSIGTLAAAGNVLDLPGSSIRDLAAGENPLDQWLPWNWTSAKNRTSGRDLLRKYGMAGRKDTWGNFGGGLAAEIALDPLTYLTFGGSALSKAGQVAKRAGLMDDLTRVAASKAGKTIGQVGKREARLTTTLGDLIGAGDDLAQKAMTKRATTAAEKMGVPLNSLMDEKLGGLVGTTLPFMEPFNAFGTGARSVKAAQLMDKVGGAIRYGKIPGTDFSPVSAVARLFDAKLHDTTTPFGNEVARGAFRAKEKARVAPRMAAAADANALKAAGLTDESAGDMLREVAERVRDPATVPPVIRDIADRIRQRSDDILKDSKLMGMPIEKLADDYTEYVARYLTESSKHRGRKDAQLLSAFDPSSTERLDMLREVPGGTVKVKELAKDLGAYVEESKRTIDDIANYIEAKHGGWLPDEYKKFNEKAGEFQTTTGRYRALAERLGRMSPETLKAGIFGNHPVVDHLARETAFADAKQSTLAFLNALKEPKVIGDAAIFAGEGKDRVKLTDLVNKVKLQWGNDEKGFGRLLQHQLGFDGTLDELAQKTVSHEHANELTKFMTTMRSPEAMNELLDVVDSVTNFSKGMWTSVWPAFHVRNRVSGTVHNMMLGIWDKKSDDAARALMKGQVVKGAKDIPAVRDLYNGTSPLTDEEATKILGEMLYGHEVIGKFEGNAVNIVGAGNKVQSGSLPDLLSGVQGPGNVSFSASRAAKKAIGREQGTNLNPLDVRGVGGRIDSGFGPAAAGEEIGHYVEGINRVAPFINQLKKGVDPAEAARKVGAAQVLYSNRYYTPFQSQFITRMFPFAKFTMGVTPTVVKELLERPGGRLGAALRAQRLGQGQDGVMPDYVRETASVPLGDALGKLPEGTDRYLTGLGLMHEDPFSFGPNAKGAGLEMLSRTNPFVKAPLELLTGQSFFQKGPDGGRKLDDMDPLIGRIAANVGLADERNPRILPTWMEQAAANSPAARGLSTVRQLTDPRKRMGDTVLPGPASLLNTLTGLSITDVSPGNKDAIVRDLLQRAEKDAGAAIFERVHFRKEDLEKMTPEQRAEAEAMQSLANLMAKRAKERAKAKEAKK